MRQAIRLAAFLAAGWAALAAAAAGAEAALRARDVLPDEGLVAGSLAVLRGPKDLDAHYYLADEAVLGLGRKTDAVLARYRTEAGEALLLVAVYPSSGEASHVYGRFGRDFFSGSFDPARPRVVEAVESGDWAGAARRGRVLIVVLEAPDRPSCDGLLLRAEARAPAIPTS
ncbi:MAG TPA: hypothetical protein P5119_06380 [Candidatus Aminicenantes bacterium]|nr:hypothetical protein [Candidatus Aminicenantes bacterium]HRY64953.1 hypothetical protein [Candidatus Aminicenantes bacterium]HRZ71866.1 hypothetical protein [Candidatus Aminicenantes bacterium]